MENIIGHGCRTKSIFVVSIDRSTTDNPLLGYLFFNFLLFVYGEVSAIKYFSNLCIIITFHTILFTSNYKSRHCT